MTLKTWALRRALGRFRITDDIVRHLSTLQRLGETVEVELPGELLPVGARTVFRAVRTRAAAQLGPDWVWPYWLQRQLDPTSPAFVPRGHLPVLTNLTARNWTAVGTVASPRKAIVDPRGLVTPWFDGWSLDWWVGADDRWHVPARERPVRQRLVGTSPVVETAMRVPGGDVFHRAYVVGGAEEIAVVEFENDTPVPVALAMAIRPYNPEGLAIVERIELDGTTVVVDGRPALLLPRAPSRVAASTFHDGDSAQTVFSGAAGEDFPSKLRCDVGLAQAAFVYPVPHRTTIRFAIPLRAERRTRRKGLTRRRMLRAPEMVSPVPSAADVARGWEAQVRRGARFDLPEGALASAVEANRKFLLLFHEGRDVTPGPFTYHRFWFRDAAYLLGALDRFGFHQESAEVLRSYPDRQHHDGFFFSQRQEWDANGCAIAAAAEHVRLSGDVDLAVELGPSISRGAAWIERKRHTRARRSDPALAGLLPPGVSAEHLGPFDYFYWDNLWGVRGLRDAAYLLSMAGRHEEAAEARRAAASMWADLERSFAHVKARLGTDALPAGPRRRLDSGAIGSLAACWPLDLLSAGDPRMVATVELVREQFCLGPGFFQGISHTGLGTYLTLQLAFVELEAGDRRALERLDWLLGAATPTWTWPEAVHPRLDGGCMGDGHHGWAAAETLSFVRNLLVRDHVMTADGQPALALCSMLPSTWWGQPLEVHDVPTRFGLLSFALRWHGERPALLWEIVATGAGHHAGPVTVTAPGLDPHWSSQSRSGEALLRPIGAPV